MLEMRNISADRTANSRKSKYLVSKNNNWQAGSHPQPSRFEAITKSYCSLHEMRLYTEMLLILSLMYYVELEIIILTKINVLAGLKEII